VGVTTGEVLDGGTRRFEVAVGWAVVAGFVAAVWSLVRELQRAIPTTTPRTARKKMSRDLFMARLASWKVATARD
jgi:hypothetical protein